MRLAMSMAAAFCLVTLPAIAQRQPNTLTPKEIEQGWILLFDGQTDYGWKSLGNLDKRPAAWNVSGGSLEGPQGPVSWLMNTTAFSTYEVRGECWSEVAMGGTVGVAREKVEKGSMTYPADVMFTASPAVAKWTTFRLVNDGRRISLSWGGSGKSEVHTTTPGQTHLLLYYLGPGPVRFRNIKLRPLGLNSIFNGKDLTGWSIVPDHKSVFTVTPQGWLNVKNGNGDIQTDGEWGDFVLQIDVFPNGDHLNSGIFFRANKGKFWSGYEDQIRNQWQDDDRTKAVDYGTGGIYNRLPARKVVSSDREWFKMTLVAHGLHIASWVNGYLVADFTDTRPSDERNARNGARTAAGVISLQGHDPTTDLSFRNIKVAEMPK